MHQILDKNLETSEEKYSPHIRKSFVEKYWKMAKLLTKPLFIAEKISEKREKSCANAREKFWKFNGFIEYTLV